MALVVTVPPGAGRASGSGGHWCGVERGCCCLVTGGAVGRGRERNYGHREQGSPGISDILLTLQVQMETVAKVVACAVTGMRGGGWEMEGGEWGTSRLGGMGGGDGSHSVFPC